MAISITANVVEVKIDVLNRVLGYADAKWNTVGSVKLYGDQSGYKLHLVTNEHGGVTSITQSGTLREQYAAVVGMLAGVRIARNENI